MKPAQLGRYQIQSELGRGAMGRVLLGYDPQIDRRVAIKIIQSFNALAGADREEARERFLREARAAGKDHQAPPLSSGAISSAIE